MMELWRQIQGYPDYTVSSHGRIKSYKRSEYGVLLVLNRHKGYRLVGLCRNGKACSKTVHRLVAQAFIPNPEGKPCINHIDCDKTNDFVNNLEWVTRLENMAHATAHGLVSKGVNHHLAKLNPEKVREIRASTLSQSKLARLYGVHRMSIKAVIIRKNWAHVV